MGSLHHLPPRGHYLAHEVGQLAGVSGYTIGQWARYGYIRASQSEAGVYPQVYSFQDIAEAMVVHVLLAGGIPLAKLGRILEALRRDPEFGAWPLSHVELETNTPPEVGATASILIRKDGLHFDVANLTWHEVIDLGDVRRIATDLRRGGWAVRELPDLEHIEVDPDRFSGRPAIRGKRLGAGDVARLATTDAGIEVLEDEYELAPAEIHDAQRWWRVVSRYEQAA